MFKLRMRHNALHCADQGMSELDKLQNQAPLKMSNWREPIAYMITYLESKKLPGDIKKTKSENRFLVLVQNQGQHFWQIAKSFNTFEHLVENWGFILRPSESYCVGKITAIGLGGCTSKGQRWSQNSISLLRYNSINQDRPLCWCHDGFAECIEILRWYYLNTADVQAWTVSKHFT